MFSVLQVSTVLQTLVFYRFISDICFYQHWLLTLLLLYAFYMHVTFIVRVQGSCPYIPIFLLPSCMPFMVLGCCLQTCAFPPGAISFLFFFYAGRSGTNWRARGRYCGCRRTPQYLAPLRWHDWSVSTDVAGWSLWTTQLETGYYWWCDASLVATGDGSRDRIYPGYRRRRSCHQSAPWRCLAPSCLVYTVYNSICANTIIYCWLVY